MQLLRLAVLRFSPEPEGWDRFRVVHGPRTLEAVHHKSAEGESKSSQTLVCAFAELSRDLELDELERVIVPTEDRLALEAVIESTAALISVSQECSHDVSSPIPAIALRPESERDHEFIARSRGFAATRNGLAGARNVFDLTPEILEALDDRSNGTILLSEVYSHKTALGKYRALIRFFELAFALPASMLDKKLTQFLAATDSGYSRDEVRSWTALRHGSIHGDGRRSADLVLEAHVRPLVGRMEQAARDVLMNKLIWHDPSRSRRDIWRPSAGSTSSVSGLRLTRGEAASLVFQMFDEFMSYPLNLRWRLHTPPEGCWFGDMGASAGQPNKRVNPTP